MIEMEGCLLELLELRPCTNIPIRTKGAFFWLEITIKVHVTPDFPWPGLRIHYRP